MRSAQIRPALEGLIAPAFATYPPAWRPRRLPGLAALAPRGDCHVRRRPFVVTIVAIEVVSADGRNSRSSGPGISQRPRAIWRVHTECTTGRRAGGGGAIDVRGGRTAAVARPCSVNMGCCVHEAGGPQLLLSPMKPLHKARDIPRFLPAAPLHANARRAKSALQVVSSERPEP